jgi:hypothetical protein
VSLAWMYGKARPYLGASLVRPKTRPVIPPAADWTAPQQALNGHRGTAHLGIKPPFFDTGLLVTFQRIMVTVTTRGARNDWESGTATDTRKRSLCDQ